MKTKITLAAFAMSLVCSQAHAGFWRDVRTNLADTLQDVGSDLVAEGIWNLGRATPAPSPVAVPMTGETAVPLPPGPGAVFGGWGAQNLPRSGVIYNRPCTFSDGVQTKAVPCLGAPQFAPAVVGIAAVDPQPATIEEGVAPEVESVRYGGGHWRGGHRAYRHRIAGLRPIGVRRPIGHAPGVHRKRR